MKTQDHVRAVSFALFALLFSCGGGSNPTGVSSAGCGNAGLCITACNLGCGPTGCGLTDIAVNQPLIFTFNQEVDPSSVSDDTIRIRTAQGEKPIGSFLVQSNVVMFVPEVQDVGGKAYFGFESQKTYILTILARGQGPKVIESISGDPLEVPFTCTLNVTKGIVDFDDRPPTARLLMPTALTNVPVDTLIALEFSEIVDTSNLRLDPKLNAVKFVLAQISNTGACANREIPLQGSITISVDRATQRTILLFRPAGRLPGDFCVRVKVSNEVRDLSGKRATPINFEFKTKSVATTADEILEDFSSVVTRDVLRNGAVWAKNAATPGKLGGTGILGDFDVRHGGIDTGKKDADGRKIYEWDTDNTTIPSFKTLTGKAIGVTDGVFEFTSFVLRENEHLRFKGTHPVVLKVTGKVRIDGLITVSAPAAVLYKKTTGKEKLGQPPLPGGPGGGRGGRGGNVAFATGKTSGPVDGFAGEGVRLPAGHPLAASASATGGMGSKANPQPKKTDKGIADMNKRVLFSAYGVISQTLSAGGGGAGFLTTGGGGLVKKNGAGGSANVPKAGDFGPPVAGGKALPLSKIFSSPKPSRTLFAIGGSGGGGAGSNPAGSQSPNGFYWNPGGAGAGGGGVLSILAGGDVVLTNLGRILARGGDGQSYKMDSSTFFNPAPGGAGSGGAVLVLSGGFPDLRGLIDLSGGKGGRFDGTDYVMAIDSYSGKGGDGFLRVEADPKPDYRGFANVKPAATPQNAGLLRAVDYEPISVLATNWYYTKRLFPPRYLYYVVKAKVDGVPVTYSDNPKIGKRAQAGEPISIMFQGGQLDPKTLKPDPQTVSRWFEGTVDPLNTDGGNGFRFMIRFDRSKSVQGKLLVQSVRVVFRG